MKRCYFAFCFVFLPVAVFSQNAAQSATFPRITPDTKAVEYGEMQNYSWRDLAEIALWASGIDPYATVTVNKEKTTYMAVLDSLAQALSVAVREEERSDAEKAELVLQFIYAKTLKRYSLNQTQLDVLLSSGTYNCVSSAVFYLILGKSIGLDVKGVVTRDHAFATVESEGALLDVETTNKFGFNPGNKKEFTDNFGKTTGFAYVPPGNYRNRAQISPIELVSLIMGNRIATLESRKRFADSLPIAVDRAALLANREFPVDSPLFSDPAADRMDRIFNVAASLLSGRKEEDVLAFADYVMPAYPDDARWEEIQYSAVNNIITKYLRSNKIADAKAALEENRSRYSKEQHDKLAAIIAQAEVVSYHNQFAAFYNRRKYEDAKAVLDIALKAFPDDRQLNRDMEAVSKAMKG